MSIRLITGGGTLTTPLKVVCAGFIHCKVIYFFYIGGIN